MGELHTHGRVRQALMALQMSSEAGFDSFHKMAVWYSGALSGLIHKLVDLRGYIYTGCLESIV